MGDQMEEKPKSRKGCIACAIVVGVVLVVGLMIVVVITKVARRQVLEMATKAEIHSIMAASAAFRADMGHYPPDTLNSPKGILGKGATFTPAFVHRNITNPNTLATNDSTKTLAFWLGTPFKISGKTYGPYTVFSLNRQVLLNPGDVVNVTQGGVTTRTIQLLCIQDHFGSCYIYDCHNPEQVRIMQGLGAKAQNKLTFDLWSLGADRSPFLPGTTQPDRGLAVTKDEEKEAMKYGDDITNWH